MIICGFPGVGKSMMARFDRAIDLESTPFEKDWTRYAKVAKHMHDSGYIVMVSTHKELLDCFEQMEVPYTVVVPHEDDLKTYVRRYEARGNSAEFIQNVVTHWDEWLYQIHSKHSVLRTVVILPKDGCLKAWFDEVNDDFCGCNRREHWYTYVKGKEVVQLVCNRCGRSVYGENEQGAKRNWNKMIEDERRIRNDYSR